jgi:hypothetical protein
MSELAFKNVTVLKGIPVDESMATMGFAELLWRFGSPQHWTSSATGS